jgi:hypothetical protein
VELRDGIGKVLVDPGFAHAISRLGDVLAGPDHHENLHFGKAPLERFGEVAGLIAA